MKEPFTLLLATHNKDKLAELIYLLNDPMIRILSMADFPQIPEVVEDRDTIEGNACKKALETAQAAGFICLADDTGLFIDALNGAPGVYAARFAGESCSYQDNRIKALELLKDTTKRQAEFRTAVALAAPDGIISLKLGRVKGKISSSEKGENGFGYDSIFELDELGKTYAELDNKEKNSLSHRALAIQAILPVIRQLTEIHSR
ncbi:MAG: RdgB/HAM1 family non-canonical purine NTP pyrophosphatase [Candidatus Cloacimonadota bacterium]